MRFLIQRVTRAVVRVDDEIVGSISRGYCVFVGIQASDTEATAQRSLQKLTELRLMPSVSSRDDLSGVEGLSENKPFDRPLDPSDGILLVPQFTLYGDLTKGRRPSFVGASPPEHSRPLFERMVALAEQLPNPVAAGVFGADMQVELVNDGPATFILDIP